MSETHLREIESNFAPGQHPNLPPPPATTGPIGWLRKNLFSSWANALLTVVSVYLLYLVASSILNWTVFNAVTTGQDQAICQLATSVEEFTDRAEAADMEVLRRGTPAELDEADLAELAGQQEFATKQLNRAHSSLGTFNDRLDEFVAGAAEGKNTAPPAELVAIADRIDTRSLHEALGNAIEAKDWDAVDAYLAEAEPLSSWGNDYGGACWTVVKVRINFFLFAFYPEDEQWRPILAGILLLLAISPLLFNVPGRRYLLWFTWYYPLVAYVLLYGSEVEPGVGAWQPITAGVLFVVALIPLIFEVPYRMAWLVLTVLYPLIGFVLLDGYFPLLREIPTDDWGGLMVTIVIGGTGIAASLPIGIMLALGRRSRMPVIRILCIAFIEAIRGVPLITLLFTASTMLQLFLPPGIEFDLLLRALIVVALFASAYMAEVIRGGLQAIPKGQYEAAAALGLGYWQMMRLIILPQALRITLPGIVNTFIGLFKDTTLVSIIGLYDFFGAAQAAVTDAKWKGLAYEIYVFCALVYFVFCFSMSRYSLYLEKKLHTGHKR